MSYNKVVNPLFDKAPPRQKVESSVKFPTVAAAGKVTLSPINNLPMVQATCAGIPVMVDLSSRIVIPVENDDGRS